MKYEMRPGRFIVTVPREMAGKPLSELLGQMAQSRKNQYLLAQEGRLLVNREPVKQTAVVLQEHDEVTVLLPRLAVEPQPAEQSAEVLYEDDFVYVVHKDPGLIIYGEPDCLAARCARWQIDQGIAAPVRPIHRLDKDTTGVLLLVKHPFFQPWYDEKLAQREVRRHYLAITTGAGHPGQHFTYNQPIGRDRHVANKYRFSATGRPALTKVEILEKKEGCLLIGCTIETGRTHQIRVHLSGNAHPIVNDPLYGVPCDRFARMGLWADAIAFPEFLSGRIITVSDRTDPDYEGFSAIKGR